MEKIRINACTTNMNKFKELSAILGDQFELVQRPIERKSNTHDDCMIGAVTETQGKPREIVERKAKEAYAMLNEPLFVEDVSLFFNAFNGLPGPYVKDFLTSMGPQGMYRMLADFEVSDRAATGSQLMQDKSATALCSICFIDGNTLETFEGRAENRGAPAGLDGTLRIQHQQLMAFMASPANQILIGVQGWHFRAQTNGQDVRRDDGRGEKQHLKPVQGSQQIEGNTPLTYCHMLQEFLVKYYTKV
ncbi:Ham1 family protein, putative [Babesia bigemina]|uniref:Ham1 family protein, putative n=1 Tax=Babesia bigemina TaxID=5866 RepID=A0A061D765_BABBI|nr:Ham1 family protein, putative [Babesia bigemina]CDR96373.1 Ham1 family protein, putative [Babesia bigemina]|eukprot:XP_012768559.1 Ham1 family protein, putative [Babesia bigemina]